MSDIEGLQVKPLFPPHPVETSVFLFRAIWEGGWRTYAHFADVVALDVLDSMVTDDAEQPGFSRAFFERVKSDIEHIRIEDGKYSAFLNSKNIF